MAKWYGVIGYGTQVETKPGVWVEQITERKYYGELLRNNRRLQTANQVNDDVNVALEISIVSDPYAEHNIHTMRYIEFMGTKWKVSTVEPRYPRLILTVGGVYNGKQA